MPVTARRSRFVLSTLTALVLSNAGCEKKEEEAAEEEAPSAAAVSPNARAEAQTIFSQRCSPCHGASGSGDGPASSGLTPPPRDFHDASWQSSVTDEHIARIIKYGGAAVGKSPAMPANPDLEPKDDVVNALVAHIRGLGGS